MCGGVVIMGAFKTGTLRQLPAFFAMGYLLCGLSGLCLDNGFSSLFGFSSHFFSSAQKVRSFELHWGEFHRPHSNTPLGMFRGT